jgi:hypothetical protein
MSVEVLRRCAVDGHTFIHDGRSGAWTCAIYLLKTEDSHFVALGRHFLPQSSPMQACGVPTHISAKVGIDILKRRCIAWIEQAALSA